MVFWNLCQGLLPIKSKGKSNHKYYPPGFVFKSIEQEINVLKFLNIHRPLDYHDYKLYI